MRELNIGDKTIRVRATPLTLLYYKQAFGSDLVGDLVKMKDIENDPSKFDSVTIMQIAWAMAKADAGPGKQFPSFETWLSELEGFDFSDPQMILAIMDEAADGFFRGGIQKGKQRTTGA